MAKKLKMNQVSDTKRKRVPLSPDAPIYVRIRQIITSGSIGMSTHDLAIAAGVDHTSITRFVSGERGLALESIEKLLSACNYELVVKHKFAPVDSMNGVF